MGGPAFSTTAEIYKQAYERTAITVTCICAPETSNSITATETVTCLIVTERSTNIQVTKSTTSKPA